MKSIAILGSTGSIGTQTLDVIAAFPDRFRVEVLSANKNVELLAKQAKEFKPNIVVIADESRYSKLSELLKDEDIVVYAGSAAIEQVVAFSTIDVVVTAMVGYSGLLPTIRAIEAGKTIALANKETLVVAGDLISKLAVKYHAVILPVDSEHSAIFQCLIGEGKSRVDKIILTASGGPFRGEKIETLQNVTPKQALKHPNWSMGAKVTIDSASMMNKGFEAIEAKWLFDLNSSQIDIVVHPQSIVHSMVQFCDNSVKAQLSLPDMRMSIQYALTYPERVESKVPAINFSNIGALTFEQPDREVFRNLGLAYEAMERGGTMPCVLNAANEVAVEAFLKGKVSFTAMSDIVEKTMEKVSYIAAPSLEDYILMNEEARHVAKELIK